MGYCGAPHVGVGIHALLFLGVALRFLGVGFPLPSCLVFLSSLGGVLSVHLQSLSRGCFVEVHPDVSLSPLRTPRVVCFLFVVVRLPTGCFW